jgi:hypothetical protein
MFVNMLELKGHLLAYGLTCSRLSQPTFTFKTKVL